MMCSDSLEGRRSGTVTGVTGTSRLGSNTRHHSLSPRLQVLNPETTSEISHELAKAVVNRLSHDTLPRLPVYLKNTEAIPRKELQNQKTSFDNGSTRTQMNVKYASLEEKSLRHIII